VYQVLASYVSGASQLCITYYEVGIDWYSLLCWPSFLDHSMTACPQAYLDPAAVASSTWSCESDVYALGKIMLQLLTGLQPDDAASRVQQALDGGGPIPLDPALDWYVKQEVLPSTAVWPCGRAGQGVLLLCQTQD
jgi:hypothetical protein